MKFSIFMESLRNTALGKALTMMASLYSHACHSYTETPPPLNGGYEQGTEHKNVEQGGNITLLPEYPQACYGLLIDQQQAE